MEKRLANVCSPHGCSFRRSARTTAWFAGFPFGALATPPAGDAGAATVKFAGVASAFGALAASLAAFLSAFSFSFAASFAAFAASASAFFCAASAFASAANCFLLFFSTTSSCAAATGSDGAMFSTTGGASTAGAPIGGAPAASCSAETNGVMVGTSGCTGAASRSGGGGTDWSRVTFLPPSSLARETVMASSLTLSSRASTSSPGLRPMRFMASGSVVSTNFSRQRACAPQSLHWGSAAASHMSPKHAGSFVSAVTVIVPFSRA